MFAPTALAVPVPATEQARERGREGDTEGERETELYEEVDLVQSKEEHL